MRTRFSKPVYAIGREGASMGKWAEKPSAPHAALRSWTISNRLRESPRVSEYFGRFLQVHTHFTEYKRVCRNYSHLLVSTRMQVFRAFTLGIV